MPAFFNGDAHKTLDTFLFTSESVGEGHPDKMCDQISDAILDEFLRQDRDAKVACEVFAKTDLVVVGGEISSIACVDLQTTIRDVIRRIGYDDHKKGFDYNDCNIITAITHQSPEIVKGVHEGRKAENIGAGDQGIVFGYATDETEECMPLTVVLSHALNKRLAYCRRNAILPWLGPDSKTQVTVEYKFEGGACIPLRVHTIVISTQHKDGIQLDELRDCLLTDVVKFVVPADLLDDRTIYHLNPAGQFVAGGPKSDAGLTGRKIIVDTYGGWGAHGGGAFSGKDPTKVDRSAAYAARWVAKSLVKARLCRRVLVQLSFAIGIAEPVSIHLDSYGTGRKSDAYLLSVVKRNFDLRPGVICKDLDLFVPRYLETAVYGHFGRSNFSWEQAKKLVL